MVQWHMQVSLPKITSQLDMLTGEPAEHFVCLAAFVRIDCEFGPELFDCRADVDIEGSLRLDGTLDPRQGAAKLSQQCQRRCRPPRRKPGYPRSRCSPPANRTLYALV